MPRLTDAAKDHLIRDIENGERDKGVLARRYNVGESTIDCYIAMHKIISPLANNTMGFWRHGYRNETYYTEQQLLQDIEYRQEDLEAEEKYLLTKPLPDEWKLNK